MKLFFTLSALVLVAAVAVLIALATEARASSSGRCTYAEIELLQVPLGFHGWEQINLRTMAALDREKRAACARVPERWRWTDRSFDRSTRLVDRLYPGRRLGAWARQCASSEGGHGAWVPNRGGSGAGGWLQFLSSTFYGVVDEALTRPRTRGVHVPALARSWYSPLGQALAGAEMVFRGRRGEWNGSTC